MRIYSLIKSLLIIIIVLGLAVIFWEGVNYFIAGNSGIPDWEDRSPVTLDRVSLSLNLDNPDDKTVLFDQNLLISGRTSSRATIIVDDDGSSSAITADSNGNFSKRIILDNGLNSMTVTAFDNQGNSKTENRTVYYSQDQL